MGTLGGQNDGGFWNFFVDLVNKYGVCPKSAMEETVSTSASSEMNYVLNTLMTKDVANLRLMRRAGKNKDDLRAAKEDMLEDIYRVLAICIGVPVSEFTYEYEIESKEENKDEPKFRRIKTTPKEFAKKYITKDLDDYVLLVNWPIKGNKAYDVFTIKYAYNVKGAPISKAINVPIDEMKECAIKALKDNNPLWFACDVTAESYRKEGYLSREVIDLDDLFSLDLDFDKGDRLQLRASQCNHAMTLTGVNLDDSDKPNRWKVQNSWGTDVGTKGIYVMTDKWFDEYVYEIAVEKKYLTDKAYKALDKEPKVLEIWDPVN
jgi:bleomycin hydrolase